MSKQDNTRRGGSRAGTLFAHAAEYLRSYGVPDHDHDAAHIVIAATGLTREQYYVDNPLIPDEQIKVVRLMLKRRATREPLQYVIGKVEFCGMDFRVGQGVLVPRPETEILAEEAAKRVESPGRILDLCTGSGCLAVTLALKFREARVLGVDSEARALDYARMNSEALGASNTEFLEGDLFAPAKAAEDAAPFDLIVSNPPYIPSAEIDTLQTEVSRWEPRAALDGGADGLDIYRRIASEAPDVMSPDGLLVLELGAGQAAAARDIFSGAFTGLETVKDIAGHERILIARLK